MERLTIYYNGSCPICGAEIRHYRALATRSGAPLDWVDVSADGSALCGYGIDRDGARRRLHAVSARGDLLQGVAAFAALWHRLPRYRWLARLVELPGLGFLTTVAYERLLAPALVALDRYRARRGAA
jgi:predicted DCC family thiol-disulfide oxidoreductase YuxK